MLLLTNWTICDWGRNRIWSWEPRSRDDDRECCVTIYTSSYQFSSFHIFCFLIFLRNKFSCYNYLWTIVECWESSLSRGGIVNLYIERYNIKSVKCLQLLGIVLLKSLLGLSTSWVKTHQQSYILKTQKLNFTKNYLHKKHLPATFEPLCTPANLLGWIEINTDLTLLEPIFKKDLPSHILKKNTISIIYERYE